MTTYRYLDADRNLLEEKDSKPSRTHRNTDSPSSVPNTSSPRANDPVESPIGQEDFAAVVSSAIKA